MKRCEVLAGKPLGEYLGIAVVSDLCVCVRKIPRYFGIWSQRTRRMQAPKRNQGYSPSAPATTWAEHAPWTWAITRPISTPLNHTSWLGGAAADWPDGSVESWREEEDRQEHGSPEISQVSSTGERGGKKG